jgi:hypothetical protein
MLTPDSRIRQPRNDPSMLISQVGQTARKSVDRLQREFARAQARVENTG